MWPASSSPPHPASSSRGSKELSSSLSPCPEPADGHFRTAVRWTAALYRHNEQYTKMKSTPWGAIETCSAVLFSSMEAGEAFFLSSRLSSMHQIHIPRRSFSSWWQASRPSLSCFHRLISCQARQARGKEGSKVKINNKSSQSRSRHHCFFRRPDGGRNRGIHRAKSPGLVNW